jgi:hypothetical protein
MYTADSGAAITVTADDVVIDLAGHVLSGTGNPVTTAVGVLAVDRKHVMVRSGTIKSFYFGIDLGASAQTPRRSVGHVVEEVTATDNTYFGIRVVGPSSRIERCRVIDTGGSTREGHTIPIGIRLVGAQNVLRGCFVRNLQLTKHEDGRGEVVGVHFDDALGGVMENNRIVETIDERDSVLPADDDRERRFGVWINGGSNRDTFLRVKGNHFAGFSAAVVFSPGSDGEAVGNNFYGASEQPIRGQPTGKVAQNESLVGVPADIDCVAPD